MFLRRGTAQPFWTGFGLRTFLLSGFRHDGISTFKMGEERRSTSLSSLISYSAENSFA